MTTIFAASRTEVDTSKRSEEKKPGGVASWPYVLHGLTPRGRVYPRYTCYG